MIARVAADAGGVYSTHIRDEAGERASSRWTRRSPPRAQARNSGRDLASQVLGAGELGAARSRRWRTSRRRARSSRSVWTRIRTSRARRSCAPEAVDGIIDIMVAWSTPLPGNERPHAGRHRARLEMHAAGGMQPPAARRCDLLPDARGRRPARAEVRSDDDRLRRPAARPASASAAVGHVPARARALRARPAAVPARGSRAPDDGAVRAAVQPARSAARLPSARSRTSSCSIRNASSTGRHSTIRPLPADGHRPRARRTATIAYRDQQATGDRAGRFLRRAARA